MIRLLACAILLPLLSAALPGHAPRPGGIAVIPLGEYATPPRVRFRDAPVLTLQTADGITAVIGIPLDQPSGDATLDVNGESVVFSVGAFRYREQYLTVKPSYVNPDPEAQARIAREHAQIAAAIAHYSDTAPTRITLQPPVPGKRSDSFGSRRFFNNEPRSPHRGMDISSNKGTPIRAPLGGTVILTGDFYFTGNAVFVDHGAGLITLYAHLDSVAVAAGDRVNEGDKLGKVGATGRVTGAHLHFATYLNGTPVDPALLLATPGE